MRWILSKANTGINDDKDMFQEMRLVLKLHRVPGVEYTPPTSHQVLHMATVNGAHASGFNNSVGTLEPGKKADIVLLNLRHIEEPYLDPEVSIVDDVLHRARGIDVDTVLVDGKIVLREGSLTLIDRGKLIQEIAKALDRPLHDHEVARKQLGLDLEPHLKSFYEGTLDKPDSPHTLYNSRL